MLYLVIEILVFVILAGLLGLACGWLLRGGGIHRAKRSHAALEAEIDNKNEALYQIRGQLAAARRLLRHYAGNSVGTDPLLAAVLEGNYRPPRAGDEVAGPAPGNGAAVRNRLVRSASRRPASRRPRWARRAQRRAPARPKAS